MLSVNVSSTGSKIKEYLQKEQDFIKEKSKILYSL